MQEEQAGEKCGMKTVTFVRRGRLADYTFPRRSVNRCGKRSTDNRVMTANSDVNVLRSEATPPQAYADFLAVSAFPALLLDLRFRCEEIHCPVSTTLSRSIPVSIPMPCSRYSTSSVATLPVAPLA